MSNNYEAATSAGMGVFSFMSSAFGGWLVSAAFLYPMQICDSSVKHPSTEGFQNYSERTLGIAHCNVFGSHVFALNEFATLALPLVIGIVLGALVWFVVAINQ